MANMKPARMRSGSDEDDAFGWRLYHDRQRNLVYYLHSYTGEVRWPRPETVGFVMHGLKPLPARSDASMMNPDIWSPYYPHVVMLPSGLVQVHPGPGSEARGATEMWCGYNRFPLINFGGNAANGALGEQQRTTGYGTAGIMPSGPRVLPPTWEEPRSGSPFLPPYPVTILGRDEAEDKRLTAPMSPSERLEERVHTPPIEASRSSFQLPSGEFRRVQGSMDWSMVTRGASSSAASTTASDCKQPAYPKTYPAPITEKKEHNRKGYLLRQARKLMRDGSNSSSSYATATLNATSKPRKTQETAKTKREFSTRPPEDQQGKIPTYGDYESISPLHC